MNLCVQGKEYESNGGTSAVGRAQFLDAHSLTFQRIEGSYSSGVEINLDDVASRFNNGESIGLMLRAQDLSQPDISSRAAKISWNLLDKSVAEYNASRFNANHATTVAGFSYLQNQEYYYSIHNMAHPRKMAHLIFETHNH